MTQKKRDNLFYSVILPSSGLPEKSSYTLREVAKMFGVTTRTLNNYINSNAIAVRVVRIAGSPRIFKADLEKVFEDVVVQEPEELYAQVNE